MSANQASSSKIYFLYFKTIIDWLLALLLLPFVLPLILLLMLWVKLDSAGPAIYSSPRVGRNGKLFPCYKLRTMVPDADQQMSDLFVTNPQLKVEWTLYQKIRRDPRITRSGEWLRKSSLDELPQIFNILRGEMSFVGPRPILEEQSEDYGALLRSYKKVKPGITGLWQVSGRNELSYGERVRLDHDYIENCSLKLDLKILLKTFTVVLQRKGAY